jgi:hypothetical protein
LFFCRRQLEFEVRLIRDHLRRFCGMALNWWEIGLLMAMAYIAVTTLVRLMARRRDQLLDDLSGDIQQQKRKST